MIAHACVVKGTEGSQVHHNDVEGLREFVLGLGIVGWQFPKFTSLLRWITLPLQWRFLSAAHQSSENAGNHVAQITKKTQRNARFKDLVEFVEVEDNIANSPLNKMMEEQRDSSMFFIARHHVTEWDNSATPFRRWTFRR